LHCLIGRKIDLHVYGRRAPYKSLAEGRASPGHPRLPVEIKQISAYSCRGMNGNSNAHISEHAFGNALDVAEFDLADGRKVSVQYGWHGTPEEQGFLHDVQAAACQEFTTVLAPGANVYHYNHVHVDLMRHYNGPFPLIRSRSLPRSCAATKSCVITGEAAPAKRTCAR
jgi:Extensin-like protein C-terminus